MINPNSTRLSELLHRQNGNSEAMGLQLTHQQAHPIHPITTEEEKNGSIEARRIVSSRCPFMTRGSVCLYPILLPK